MGKLSAAGAAFYGFGLIRRDPLTFLGVSLVCSALGLLTAVTLLPAYAQFFSTAMSGAQADPAASMQAMSALNRAVGPFYLAAIPIYMVMLGALNRSLVFGSSKGWLLGLKMGMDEVRAIIVTFVGSILVLVPYIGAVVLGMVVAAIGAGLAGATGQNSVALVGLLAIPIFVIGVCLMIWVGIRLSLAVPASIGEKKWVVFESWSMTKGRFWTLFLAYLILYLIMFLIYTVATVGVAAAMVGSAAVAGSTGPDLSALQNVSLGPITIAGSIVYGVVSTLFGGAFLGVAARGYVAWKETAAPAVSATFA
jgi:hypothetical protein